MRSQLGRLVIHRAGQGKAADMSELVTGEAVALELRPARLPSRVLAVVIDLIVVMVVYIAVTIALVAASSSLDDAAQAALSIAAFLLLLVGGPIAVETLSHGRSLGKLAVGLRVVRDDGGPIRFRHALVRGAIGVVEILMTFGVVACIASLVSARGRRLGDVFAGTLVVRERIPVAPGGFVPPPPPWLAGRFSQLDLSAVPDGLWLAIRQYLTRMHQLDQQVGWAMAERLASDLATHTGAPAPQGVPPGAYLAAVVQERQAREARRSFGNGMAQAGPSPVTGSAPAVGVAGGYLYPGAWPATASSPQPSVAYGYAAGPVVGLPSDVPAGGASRENAEGVSEGGPSGAPSAGRPASGFAPPA
jgi:uncharacterized RDD family membrane protein YckC